MVIFVCPSDRTDMGLLIEGDAEGFGRWRLGRDGEGGRDLREGASHHPSDAVWFRPDQREAAPLPAAGIIVPGEAATSLSGWCFDIINGRFLS
jgi:hypothetical protein